MSGEQHSTVYFRVVPSTSTTSVLTSNTTSGDSIPPVTTVTSTEVSTQTWDQVTTTVTMTNSASISHATSMTTENPSASNRLSPGVIAGIVLGAVGFLIISTIAGLLYRKTILRRRSRLEGAELPVVEVKELSNSSVAELSSRPISYEVHGQSRSNTTLLD